MQLLAVVFIIHCVIPLYVSYKNSQHVSGFKRPSSGVQWVLWVLSGTSITLLLWGDEISFTLVGFIICVSECPCYASVFCLAVDLVVVASVMGPFVYVVLCRSCCSWVLVGAQSRFWLSVLLLVLLFASQRFLWFSYRCGHCVLVWFRLCLL